MWAVTSLEVPLALAGCPYPPSTGSPGRSVTICASTWVLEVCWHQAYEAFFKIGDTVVFVALLSGRLPCLACT